MATVDEILLRDILRYSYTAARRAGAQHDDALDIAQIVAVKFWRCNIDPHRWQGWVGRAARWATQDHFKAVRRRRAVSLNWTKEYPDGRRQALAYAVPDPATTSEAAEARVEVWDTVAVYRTLPAHHQTALWCASREMPQERAARFQGVPVGTAKDRLLQARRRLRTVLDWAC